MSIGYRKEIDHALERIAAIEKYPRPGQEDRRLAYTIQCVATDRASSTAQ